MTDRYRFIRIDLAMANAEPAEVLYELIMDLASALDFHGLAEDGREARRIARTLLPMFGEQAERDRAKQPWWRRRKWTPPDYRARADLYRSDVSFRVAP